MCARPEKPRRLVLRPDHSCAYGENDTIQIDCSLTDQDGIVVPGADLPVSFAVLGDAKAVGTENGDRLDLTPLASCKEKPFMVFAR